MSNENYENENQQANQQMSQQVSQQANQQGNQQNNQSLIIFMVLILIGGIMCTVGVFLPYVKASSWMYNVEYSFQELAKNDYVLFIAVGALCIVFGLVRLNLLSMVGGIIYAIMFYVDSHNYWERIKSDSSSAMASKGIGYYCMLIGCIIVIVFGLSGFLTKLKNKTGK